MPTEQQSLWDIPTRLCHWLIVICLPLSWWSAETQNYQLHKWLGYTVIVLVLSRIIWGFIGSRHSRFSDFLVGPKKIAAYVRGDPAQTPGHNPLGGWSVMALLFLLLLQAVSGLFNTDDIFFNGPLYYGASVELRGRMGQIHGIAFDLLLTLIALHITAVFYHQFRKREPLLQAMVRGGAQGKRGVTAPVPAWRALVVVALVSLALYGLLQLAPEPPPMMW